MLDSTSLDTINRFKSALARAAEADLAGSSNRGRKLHMPTALLDTLTTKVVDYHGKEFLALTNDSIERDNARNKRKWSDIYGNDASDSDYDDDSDDDRHILKTIRLADILSPLNHPLEIVTHPAISKTYKLQVFNHMALDLIDMIEVEQNNLNWLNKLLQVLNGEDWYYLLDDNLGLASYDHDLVERGMEGEEKAEDKEESKIRESKDTEGRVEGSEGGEGRSEGRSQNIEKSEGAKSDEKNQEISNSHHYGNSNVPDVDPFFALPETLRRYEESHLQFELDDELAALKDDLVNYLQVSIQRQHEYVKNLMTIRGGIVRADRLRRDLYKWGREMNEKRA